MTNYLDKENIVFHAINKLLKHIKHLVYYFGMDDKIKNISETVLNEILTAERAAASSPNNISTRRQNDLIEIIKDHSEKILQEDEIK